MRFPGFIQARPSDVRGTILRSEQIRVASVSASALVATTAAFLRVSFSKDGFGADDFPGVAALLLLAFVAYEILSLFYLRRRLKKDQMPNFLKSWIDAAMEGVLPFVLGAVAILDTYANPYVVVSGPLVMAALLLVILSILRLNAWMSLATGVSATIGYVLLVLWIYFSYSVEEYGDYNYQRFFFPIATGMLAAATALAIVISGQARVWLQTAWSAAEVVRKRRESERELQLAGEVQQALFPRDWPDGGVFDLAASSRPATQLGGDFYDWMPVSEDRVVLCLADVTGHGAASAILGAEARAYLRASVWQANDLLDLATSVEKLLQYDLRDGRFVTMLLVLLHTVDGSLDVYSAGQGPVLILRKSGSIEEVEIQRAPLGIPWEAETSVTKVEFGVGDVLVAVSDGVLDRANQKGESLGVKGLIGLLERLEHSTARGLVDAVFRAVDEYADGVPATDDSSVVVVRCVDEAN